MPGSGEAIAFDPFVFVPGGGVRSGVSAAIKPGVGMAQKALNNYFRQALFRQTTTKATQTATTAAKTGLRANTREVVRKISPNLAVAGGSAVTLAALSQTPASVENIKNVSQATEATADAAGQFGNFIQKNPVLVYSALGLIGLVVVVSLVKK